MAKRIDTVVQKFIEANGLELVIVWGKPPEYQTDSGTAYTEDQLRNLKGYPGFVDGFASNPPKNKGRAREEEITKKFSIQFTGDNPEEEDVSISLTETPLASYDQQYTLGASMRKR